MCECEKYFHHIPRIITWTEIVIYWTKPHAYLGGIFCVWTREETEQSRCAVSALALMITSREQSSSTEWNLQFNFICIAPILNIHYLKALYILRSRVERLSEISHQVRYDDGDVYGETSGNVYCFLLFSFISLSQIPIFTLSGYEMTSIRVCDCLHITQCSLWCQMIKIGSDCVCFTFKCVLKLQNLVY